MLSSAGGAWLVTEVLNFGTAAGSSESSKRCGWTVTKEEEEEEVKNGDFFSATILVIVCTCA